MAPIEVGAGFLFLDTNFPNITKPDLTLNFPHRPAISEDVLESAFVAKSLPVAPWRPPSLFSTSPLGFLFGLTGCANQNSTLEESQPNATGGASGAPVDAGTDAPPVDAGPELGSSPPICQVQMSVAVFFYDCIEMANTGEAGVKVCLSGQKFGGDVQATHEYIESGISLLQDMYRRSCSPFGVNLKMFYPKRTMNGRLDSPDNEFTDSQYRYNLAPLANDLNELGEDSLSFGSYVVLHAWDKTIIPTDTPRTRLRTSPPFAVISYNLSDYANSELAVSIKHVLRHELYHGVEDNALQNGLNTFIGAHDGVSFCSYPWDARWLCLIQHDQDGNPHPISSLQNALAERRLDISCSSPEWLQSCTQSETKITCGETECPDLPGRYEVECNPQQFCEYGRKDILKPWQVLDRWIYVPQGSNFIMGTDEGALGHTPEEAPAHPVTFAQGFFIGKYEVPVEAYEECIEAGACESPILSGPQGTGWGLNTSAARPLHPANHVTWEGALNVCEWIYPGARHPNAPEWEFAARGLQGYLFPHGNSVPTCGMNQGNFNEQNTAEGFGCGSGGTIPVNAKQVGVSPIGAFGMAGNVWEWTTLCRYPNYNNAPSNGLPDWSIPCSYGDRDLRGGGYNDTALKLRAPGGYHANYKLNKPNIGVRCALSAYWVHP